MARNRVLSLKDSFMNYRQRSPSVTTPDSTPKKNDKNGSPPLPPHDDLDITPNQTALGIDAISAQLQEKLGHTPPSPRSPTAASRARADSRATTRPNSMMMTYNPPQMELSQDTPPELQPIFTFLNSHSNKLYQEGYFLKLHDLDTRGRPSLDRVWTECFAQLVGTVLSLWDAAALDQAGEDGEVVPTFINLSDASIRMIESLPMNGASGGSLQNVLSVSTAANNRYLLHFNSLNSLTQWTAGIRLAMFEHSTLQEAYTGSLIAGKGRFLNNIKQIMDRSKFTHEDWARVRFGAGTPWRRCWCIITPPDEKEYQKAQKNLKKTSSYSRALMPKGDIKFYDTRKVTKKTKPIATITDAYAAYAIYPQSKPLIDQSTLVKLEGLVTDHTKQETTTEGFVFVMPEVHPAVSGFEMMLQWLFRVFDTFALYGRPTRLIADTLDQRGLMFAMPKDRRYGYLDILDVSTLIHTSGSSGWSERQWRKEMKKLTSTKLMNRMDRMDSSVSKVNQRRNTTSRQSLPPARMGGVQFQDQVIHSTPGSRTGSPTRAPMSEKIAPPRRTDSAPPGAMNMSPHKRSVSEAQGYRKYKTENRSRLSQEINRPDDEEPPPPPRHGGALGTAQRYDTLDRINSNDQQHPDAAYERAAHTTDSPNLPPPEPVLSPPAFQHTPNSRPLTEPYQAPELRRAHSNVDAATLYQMQDAVRPADDEVGVAMGDPDRSGESLPYRYNNGLVADQPQEFLGNGTPRDARQRLSTIPGSPYTGADAEYFQSPQQALTVPMEEVMRDQQAPRDRPPIAQLHSSHSITRKPVPKQQSQGATEAEQNASGRNSDSQVRAMMAPVSPDSPVSASDGFYDAVVDQEALERILNDSGRTSTIASSATPDYASVESSEREVKKPKEWQRPGKLKTVGDPDLPTVDAHSGGAGKLDTFGKEQNENAADMPAINFGPTYIYKPNSRPGTSGTITPGDMDKRSRSRSADRLRQSTGSRLSGHFATPSPGEGNRHSYFGGRSTPTGIEIADTSGNRRSIAWTPGSGPITTPMNSTPQMRQALSPEEWVQHRASHATQAPVPHRRSPSSLSMHHQNASTGNIQQMRRSMTKTPPPFVRTSSGDWTGQSGTPPNRPNSRGASMYLGSSPGGGLSSSSLTAKEQMAVAKATGTPLLNVKSNTGKEEEQAPGLVGALAARQREKATTAQGLRSGMVQHAIAARQQQQMQLEAEAQAQAQFEMQQRAQQQYQAQQYQQMAYQQAMMNQQASMAYQQQQQAMAPQMQYGPNVAPAHGRASSMQMPAMQPQSYNSVPQTSSQAGGFGGQYVQQQASAYHNPPPNQQRQPPRR